MTKVGEKTRVLTEEQKQRRRENHRENYNYRKSLGLCPIYGCVEEANPGNVLCHSHLLARRRENQRRRGGGIEPANPSFLFRLRAIFGFEK